MKLTTRNPSRATVLYLALLFVAIINLLALAYVRAIPTEGNSFLRSKRATTAHYVCEAGVFDAMAYVSHQIQSGLEPTPSGPVTLNGTLQDWSWTVTITADPDSPPHGTASLRFYEVLSQAFAPNSSQPARTIRATMGEETFARYTRYIDQFIGINYIIPNTPFIEGHIHTNTYFKMEPQASLWSTSGPPAFNGYVTSVQSAPGSHDGVRYYGSEAPHDTAGAPIGSRYTRLYLGGQAGLNTGVNRIDLPQSANALATRAWGDAGTQPTTTGLHLNLDTSGAPKGGYYVVGDIDTFRLGMDPLGNPLITFTQGTETYEIVEVVEAPVTINGVNAVMGSTVVTNSLGTTAYPGIGNGVHYATGSILDFQGTNRGERLVVVEIANDAEIIVTGNVFRADTSPGSRPPGSRDVLGLVGYKIWLSDTIPRSYSNPLYLYFSFLAGRHNDTSFEPGGFYVQSWDNSALGTGTYYLYGAAGSGRNGPSGMWSGGTQSSGFGYRQYFDQHLLDHPPPHYPTTDKLPIRSWREEDGQL